MILTTPLARVGRLVRCRLDGTEFALGPRLDRCPECGELNVRYVDENRRPRRFRPGRGG